MDSKWPARAAGAAAGLANGLFGGGGGMVFLPILSRFGRLDQRKLYATCVGVIFPVCLVSAAIYVWRGGVSLGTALPYLAGGAFGRLPGREALRKGPREAPQVALRRLPLLRGREVPAVTDWLLPLSLRPGSQRALRLGRGRRDAAAPGDDAVPGRGPADGPGDQPALLPARRRQRPGVPCPGRLSGPAHPPRPPCPWRCWPPWRAPGWPSAWTWRSCGSPSACTCSSPGCPSCGPGSGAEKKDP